jgi:hypothetical protein
MTFTPPLRWLDWQLWSLASGLVCSRDDLQRWLAEREVERKKGKGKAK